MKFTILSNGDFHINCGAKNNSTVGNNILDIFGKKVSKKPTKDDIPQLDNQMFNGTIDGNLNSSVEMEIGIDEFKELSMFCKEHLNLEKDSARFLYHGIKKFLDDLINGIKNRGSEIVNIIGNINKDYLKKKFEINRLEKELKEKETK